MKKLFFSIVAACMAMLAPINANAYEFDGIDLNAPQQQVTKEIAMKGYVYNQQKNSLVGVCQGKEIALSLNLEDVTENGHVGQLVVTIPMDAETEIKGAMTAFNVIYHKVSEVSGVAHYAVSNDGTTMTLVRTAKGIQLTYSTPYYRAKK